MHYVLLFTLVLSYLFLTTDAGMIFACSMWELIHGVVLYNIFLLVKKPHVTLIIVLGLFFAISYSKSSTKNHRHHHHHRKKKKDNDSDSDSESSEENGDR